MENLHIVSLKLCICTVRSMYLGFFNDVLINFTNKAITSYLPTHHINGVMVKVLDSNVMDHGFKPM